MSTQPLYRKPLFIAIIALLSFSQVYIASGSEQDLLSVNVTNSKLGLVLIGTISNDDNSKAVLKNPVTGEIKKYIQGEHIDIINSANVKLVEVSNCIVLIDRGGSYETLECENRYTTAVFQPQALARYRIVHPGLNMSSEEFTAKYDSVIKSASRKHGVDPYLVKAVIKAESNFNPDAVSPKNAQGMMQLIPDTADDYGLNNPFDPTENIEAGVHHLKDLIKYFDGDIKLSLAAYNAGKGAVVKHGFTIPPYPETTNYISKVLRYYKVLKSDKYLSKN